MGVDFLARTAPSFKKAVSRDSAAVARMSCSVSSGGHRRVVMADTAPHSLVKVGQHLVVKEEGNQLVIVMGLREVGRVTAPPPEVIRTFKTLGGFAEGVVEHVNNLGGTFDVALP